MADTVKHYSNGEVTVVWKPDMCIHSRICFRGLPDVFDPRKRPWITPEHSNTAAIIEQVDKCPSGALSYFMNSGAEQKPEALSEIIVEAAKNGPLMVYGNITVKDARGNESTRHKVTAFCRCGASANKPFCDGTHVKIEFKD